MKISVTNQKGGVGKTTTAVNLAGAFAELGKSILLVDIDAQANTTNSMGINDKDLEKTVFDLLDLKVTKEEVKDVIIKTEFNIDVLPSNISLAVAEQTLVAKMNREYMLKKILNHIESEYDLIIIDTPPSLGLLSINSLVAADYVIVPIYASYFSIKGISDLIDTLNLVQENINENLEIMGVLLSRFDSRKKISIDIKDNLGKAFEGKVFNTFIRQSVDIEYAQDEQKPVNFYNNKSNGSIDYLNLAKEILERYDI